MTEQNEAVASSLLSELNASAVAVLDAAKSRYEEYGIVAHRTASGARLIDFASNRAGSLAGGLLLARALMANLAQVEMTFAPLGTAMRWPMIQVRTDQPLLACMASQYAGWQLMHDGYFAIASGPGRVLRGREALLDEYRLRARPTVALVGLESARLPDEGVLLHIAESCGVSPNQLSVCIARTASLPGSLQIVARSVETTMHKLHELRFDLHRVKAALGTAPLPPVGRDDLQSIGWTNDAILLGAHVTLWVDGPDGPIREAADRLCSETSDDFGRPFAQLFEDYERDFYRIDRMLFSPAAATIIHVEGGWQMQVGRIHDDLLTASFAAGQG